MRAKNAMITQWVVRMICIIALLFVGSAHQPLSSAKGASVPPELAEYVLPDGTLPVICIAGKADKIHKHDKAKVHGCEACQIAASVLLPIPDKDQAIDVRVVATLAAPYEETISPQRNLPPNSGPRAPPLDPALV